MITYVFWRLAIALWVVTFLSLIYKIVTRKAKPDYFNIPDVLVDMNEDDTAQVAGAGFIDMQAIRKTHLKHFALVPDCACGAYDWVCLDYSPVKPLIRVKCLKCDQELEFNPNEWSKEDE